MWLAGWNMPGCLPEVPPYEFDHWHQANDFVKSELESDVLIPADTLADTLADWEGQPTDADRRVLVYPYLFWIEWRDDV